MGRLLGLVAFVWATWYIDRFISIGFIGGRAYVEGQVIGLTIAAVIVLLVVLRFIALFVGALSLTKDSRSSY